MENQNANPAPPTQIQGGATSQPMESQQQSTAQPVETQNQATLSQQIQTEGGLAPSQNEKLIQWSIEAGNLTPEQAAALRKDFGLDPNAISAQPQNEIDQHWPVPQNPMEYQLPNFADDMPVKSMVELSNQVRNALLDACNGSGAIHPA